jgi:hypothetical protein
MRLFGKAVALRQLRDELQASGINLPALGISGDNLLTYNASGALVDLPAGAQAVLDAHVPAPPPPTPDYGADLPSDYREQLAQAVSMLRQYLGLSSPTLAQSATALRLLIRIEFFLLRQHQIG